MKYIAAVIFCFFIGALFLSCTDDKAPQKNTNPVPAAENPKGTDTAVKKPVQTPRPTPKPQDNKIISLDPVNTKEPRDNNRNAVAASTTPFAYNPASRIIPRDFQIGPLQDAYSDSREYLSAYRIVRSFFTDLMKKEVKEEYFSKAAFKPLEISLKYPVKQDYLPEKVRLGKAMFVSTDEVRINVRMYKGAGVSIGEVYLKKEDSEWKIGDLQLGFVLLREKYIKSREPYVPSQYDFLLEN